MFGAATLTDEVVRAAAGGSQLDLARVSEAMLPQTRLMVWARLAPTANQLPAVDDITQDVMLALTEGISRLDHRTVGGLKAFVSGIVAHKVAEAVARLPRKFREVIVLRDIQQLSYEEIGEVLQIPGGTVRSRINRARLALKGLLDPSIEGSVDEL